MEESNRPSGPSPDEPIHDRQARRVEAAALVWPAICAAVTLSVVLLSQTELLRRPFRRLVIFAALADAVLAVAVSAALGVISARDDQRLPSAVAFGIWSFLVYFGLVALGSFFLKLAGFRV